MSSALISGAEVAFFSLSALQLEELEQATNRAEKTVAMLRKKPKRLLATILVTNNLINIATVLLFASLGEVFFNNIDQQWIRLLIEVGIITFMILFFGEILPKVYASRNPIKFSKVMALPVQFLDRYIFFFLTIPMSRLSYLIQKRLGNSRGNLSVDQLSKALELTDEEDTTDEEHQILQGIVSFGNIETKQAMRPRIDVFALANTMPFDAVLEAIRNEGYSRIPVYNDNIDSIIGVLYVKDLLPHLSHSNFDWTSLLRAPYFVPENKKLDDLLKEFQSMKMHLAVVVDEYGGTSGIITLEDVIEEIVGDISDEFDDDDLEFSRLDETTWVIEGKTLLKDFYRIIDLEDEALFENNKGDSESLAGFVLEQTGGFPKIGEKITFDNFDFSVEALDRKRLKRIKVHRKNQND